MDDAGKVVLSPHPAVYARAADKRQLTKMHHQVSALLFAEAQSLVGVSGGAKDMLVD